MKLIHRFYIVILPIVFILGGSNLYLTKLFQEREYERLLNSELEKHQHSFTQIAGVPLIKYYFIAMDKGYLEDALKDIREIKKYLKEKGEGLLSNGVNIKELNLVNELGEPLVRLTSDGCDKGKLCETLEGTIHLRLLRDQNVPEVSTREFNYKLEESELLLEYPIWIGIGDQTELKGHLESKMILPALTFSTRIGDFFKTSLIVFLAQLFILLLVLIYFGWSIAKPFERLLERIRSVSRGEILISDSMVSKNINEFLHMDRSLRELSVVIREKENGLVSALKEAQDASETKMRFLANMSHELRTPMAGVLGVSRILKKKDIPRETQDYLDIIIRSGENLLKILNEVLDLSKIESKKMEVERLPFSLREVIDGVLPLYAFNAKEKGVELHYEQIGSLPHAVMGSSQRLSQVLANLVGNALKFTNQGMVNLVVANIEETKDTAKILFAVEDSGIGITADALKRLFNPFTQADISTTRRYGGSGLGLALSLDFVELMGGDNINVDTTVGEGSRFYFVLPFKKSDERFESRKRSLEFLATPFDHLHVLVAEDDEVNRLVISENLKQIGIKNIDLVENGEIAVKRVKDEMKHYHVIFMDCHMPVMDGYAATREIVESGVKIPVVALTADAMKDNQKRCFDAGMKEFLSKPFLVGDLKRVLSRVTTGDLSSTLEKKEVAHQQAKIEVTRFNFAEFDQELFAILKMQGCMNILNKFESSFTEKKENFKKYYDERDFETLRREIHSVKGNAGAIRGTYLREICVNALAEIDAKKYDRLPGYIDEIIEEAPKLVDIIKDHLSKKS